MSFCLIYIQILGRIQFQDVIDPDPEQSYGSRSLTRIQATESDTPGRKLCWAKQLENMRSTVLLAQYRNTESGGGGGETNGNKLW